MTISIQGNHLKSCNNNQPLHHEKTAPRPACPPTATLRNTDLPLKKGILQEEMLGVAQFWELVSHLYNSSFGQLRPTIPLNLFGFQSACTGDRSSWRRNPFLGAVRSWPWAVWKRLLLSVPGPLQKRSQLQQWLKVLCCGGFSLLLIGTESEHGTTCFSIWPFPIRTTGKILIAGPCESFCV